MWPLPKFVDNLQTIFERENIHGKSNLASSDDYSMQKEAWKAILIPLGCSALAAGIAAVWNAILQRRKNEPDR